MAAAAYLAITVAICRPVAYWCLDFNLAVGSLLASTILFFIPLALLAVTGPFLVRVITSSVSGVGGNVGRLTSISTLGSFAGTMLIGYIMLPLLPNSVTMCLMAAALALVCAGYFAFFRRRAVGPSLVLSLGLASLSAFLATKSSNHNYSRVVEKFFGNSFFGQIQVVEGRNGGRRAYLNDNLTQNTYQPELKQSLSTFTYMLSGLARAYTTNINDVLCIGLGVGIVPMDFTRKGSRVDVVEINPAVVPVAEKYFDLDTNKLHISIDDGRHFLNRCRKNYDAVILDAFLGDSSPSHLMTKEAFTSMKEVLRPGGVLVINVFCSIEDGRDFFAASLGKTLKAVFAGVKMHSSGAGQIYIVATDHPQPAFVHEPDLRNVNPEVLPDAEAVVIGVVEPIASHGRVLTDDFNPVEFYDAHNRELLRRMLAFSAKEM
jgi:spermidine synthase